MYKSIFTVWFPRLHKFDRPLEYLWPEQPTEKEVKTLSRRLAEDDGRDGIEYKHLITAFEEFATPKPGTIVENGHAES